MWKDLTLQQKAEIMKMSVANGVTDINDIRALYDGQVEHEFKGGGYVSSKSIRDRISKWEGSSMYAPAPDTGKVNRPFSAEERDFWRVIPDDIKPLLTQDMADALFSTSYNIGAGNFKKRVVPQLRKVLIDGTGTVEDITNSMYGTRDKEPKMKGLRTRRATERKLFTDAYNTAYLNNVPQVDSNALYTPAQELRWNKPISQPTFRPLQMPQAPMQISMPRVETTPITPIEKRVPISDTLPDISPLLLSLPDQQGFTPHRMVTPQYQPVNLNLDSPYLLFRS